MVFHPTQEELSRLLDGELGSQRLRVVLDHVGHCSRCQALQGAYSQVRLRVRGLPRVEGSWDEAPRLSPAVQGWLIPRGLVVGVLVGMVGMGIGVWVWPNPPALKVVSRGVGTERLVAGVMDRIPVGEAVQAIWGGDVDLEIPGQVLFRMKAGSTITWEQGRGMWIGKRPVVVNLLRGGFVARTRESFFGSRLEVRTPSGLVQVRGTVFSMEVEPKADATMVSVLAGKVFFSPYIKGVGVEVAGGQGSRMRGGQLPEVPRKLGVVELEGLMEGYRIGEDPDAVVAVGIGEGRVEELLRGAPLYVSDRRDSRVHPLVKRRVKEINAALWEGRGMDIRAVKVLEVAVNGMRDGGVAVPFRLYAGSVAMWRGDPVSARLHFERVVEGYPDHPQASLALGAVGELVRRGGDLRKAREIFKDLLHRYPKSPEAPWAREFLQRYPL